MKDLEAGQIKIEEFAEQLCWEKISEIDGIAIWRKPINLQSCYNNKWSHVKTCNSANPDDVWYKEMEVCKTRNPIFEPIQLEPFPKRLYAVPPRIASGAVPRISPNMYRQDSELWRKCVEAYMRVNKFLDTNRYRNVMDMSAGIGGFGATAIPTLASVRTLPWGRTNLNPTAQALIVSTVAGMAYFIVADKTVLATARKNSFAAHNNKSI